MPDVKDFFSKMKGGKTCPPRAPISEIFWSTQGGCLGIAAVYLCHWSHTRPALEHKLFLVGSFGASAVLLYGIPLSPFAQPRNLIVGHLISALTGVSFYLLFPQQTILVAPLAVGIAIGLMHLTRTLHPPGGATALIAVIGGNAVHQLGYLHAITPIGLGAGAVGSMTGYAGIAEANPPASAAYEAQSAGLWFDSNHQKLFAKQWPDKGHFQIK